MLWYFLDLKKNRAGFGRVWGQNNKSNNCKLLKTQYMSDTMPDAFIITYIPEVPHSKAYQAHLIEPKQKTNTKTNAKQNRNPSPLPYIGNEGKNERRRLGAETVTRGHAPAAADVRFSSAGGTPSRRWRTSSRHFLFGTRQVPTVSRCQASSYKAKGKKGSKTEVCASALYNVPSVGFRGKRAGTNIAWPRWPRKFWNPAFAVPYAVKGDARDWLAARITHISYILRYVLSYI